MNLTEKKIRRRDLYENPFLKVYEDDVTIPDGSESKRIVVEHVGAVNVIALTENKELILVRQFRYPMGEVMLETPAGRLEAGEEPVVTAKRELEEETGYTCADLKFLGKHASTPGYTSEYLYQFLATHVTKLTYEVQGDIDEFTEVVLVDKKKAEAMVANGEIKDLKTVYAVQYLSLHDVW